LAKCYGTWFSQKPSFLRAFAVEFVLELLTADPWFRRDAAEWLAILVDHGSVRVGISGLRTAPRCEDGNSNATDRESGESGSHAQVRYAVGNKSSTLTLPHMQGRVGRGWQWFRGKVGGRQFRTHFFREEEDGNAPSWPGQIHYELIRDFPNCPRGNRSFGWFSRGVGDRFEDPRLRFPAQGSPGWWVSTARGNTWAPGTARSPTPAWS